MAAMPVLGLQIAMGREEETAQAAASQMRPEHWEAVCRFAAAVVAEQERRSTGQVVLVAPMSRDRLRLVE